MSNTRPHRRICSIVIIPIDCSDYRQDVDQRGQLGFNQSITSEWRYFLARTTAQIYKLFTFLWIVAGVVVIVLTIKRNGHTAVSQNSNHVALAVEYAATLLGAAMFSFFAYVLDLLRGIWEEVAAVND